MNKKLLSGLVVSAFFSMGAYAASSVVPPIPAQESNSAIVHFIGSVTDVTCNIVPEYNGVQGATIQLGTMNTTDNASTPVTFKLVAKAGTACSLGEHNNVDISWNGGLNSVGLINRGTASNVAVALKPLNDKTSGSASISLNNKTSSFDKTVLGDNFNQGASYEAKMISFNGTPTAGTVIADSTFSVSYN